MQNTISYYQRQISWINLVLGLIISILGNITPNINGFLGFNWTFSINTLWFITNSTLLLCTVVLILRVVNTLAAKANKNRPPGYLRRTGLFIYDALSGTVLTAEIVIMLIFWPLFIADRINGTQLMLPKHIAANLGIIPNLCQHFFMVLLMGVNYLSDRRPLESKKAAFSGMVFYTAGCTFLMAAFNLWFKPGRWVYPPLRLIPTPGKLVLPLGALLILCPFYLAVRALKARDSYELVTRKVIRAVMSSEMVNLVIAALLVLLGMLLYYTFQTMSIDWTAIRHEAEVVSQDITQTISEFASPLLASIA